MLASYCRPSRILGVTLQTSLTQGGRGAVQPLPCSFRRVDAGGSSATAAVPDMMARALLLFVPARGMSIDGDGRLLLSLTNPPQQSSDVSCDAGAVMSLWRCVRFMANPPAPHYPSRISDTNLLTAPLSALPQSTPLSISLAAAPSSPVSQTSRHSSSTTRLRTRGHG